MSVGSIKRLLNGYQVELQRCITACNSLIQKLNGVKDWTSNTICLEVSSLKREIDKQGNHLRTLSIHTKKELHIFFKEYNTELTRQTERNKQIKNNLTKLDSLAKEVYDLCMLSFSMECFLKYNVHANDLRKYTPLINQYKNELIKLQLETRKRNQELIQKAR